MVNHAPARYRGRRMAESLRILLLRPPISGLRYSPYESTAALLQPDLGALATKSSQSLSARVMNPFRCHSNAIPFPFGEAKDFPESCRLR